MFVRPNRYYIKRAVWAAAAFALCVGHLDWRRAGPR